MGLDQSFNADVSYYRKFYTLHTAISRLYSINYERNYDGSPIKISTYDLKEIKKYIKENLNECNSWEVENYKYFMKDYPILWILAFFNKLYYEASW